ncbi:signal transduction histidine kinase [Halobacteroides halobius DSM 5150]|uniref:histidine kinase n=1 Tax=Halobacteroides halobius (strain ATCC 35273 / DSM 5150 / MD-1) TaxID=748449 RepID=L0K7S0_HALHC|nr:HAMP domain-containing sensor histidine kinase [Halobacteroides halobius]AGB40399.1 signal transduction histidine kinase [Halobacteroides halobius DSM 5150]
MKFDIKSFFGRLMLSHLIIILISLLVIGIIFGYLIQNYYFGLKEWKVTRKGQRIAKLVSRNVSENKLKAIEIKKFKDKINTISRSSNMDIAIVNRQGEIIFDSIAQEFNLTIKNNEIQRVLAGNRISKKIMGPDNKSLLMIFPLFKTNNNNSIILESKEWNSKIIGGIVLRTPMGSVTETINEITKLILYSFLIAMIAAIFLSYFFARRVTKPLMAINNAAMNLTEGNFKKVKPPSNSSEEIENLVNSFNYAVDQIDETLQEKKHLERMRREFVANVSHEFRAPLTSIKGFLELLLEHDLDKSEIKQYSQIMYKDTEYLEHLLEDLLILSKCDSKSLSLNKEYVTPNQLINRAVKSSQNKLKKKNLDIKVELADDLPNLYVDSNRIHQVLINLLENAITYSPFNGQIIISVQQYKPDQDVIKFSVTDQGPGISQKEKEKVWQRFYKIDTARTRKEKEGSGLGLAIVKDIISKHGGEVKLESKLGEGTTFSFILGPNSIDSI